MSRDELVPIVGAFVALGVEKVRLTGGEPLLRGDLPEIIRHQAPRRARRLADDQRLAPGEAGRRASRRGLDRLNVSVDSLDEATAGRMNGLGFSVGRVLAGIDAAAAAGFPVKVNCVVQRGVNDGEILPLCEYFRERGHTLRFIEFMDVGNTNHWSLAGGARPRDRRADLRRVAARARGPRLQGRGRGPLPLRGRPRRDRHRQLGDGALLQGLQPGAALGRREALHVPLRLHRVGRPGPPEVGRGRRAAPRVRRRHLDGRARPLQRRAGRLLAAGAGREKVEMSYIGG
jgi:GTP 3',8-cyclase